MIPKLSATSAWLDIVLNNIQLLDGTRIVFLHCSLWRAHHSSSRLVSTVPLGPYIIEASDL